MAPALTLRALASRKFETAHLHSKKRNCTDFLHSETVTVTKEGPTVYVTVGSAAPTGTSSVPLAANAAVPTAASESSPESSAPASTGDDSEDDDTCEEDGEDADSSADGEDDTCDEEPEETVTATVVPVPTGSNGTGSAYPTGAALKNRFAKMY